MGLKTSLLGRQKSVLKSLLLAGKVYLTIANLLLQTCLAASHKTFKYSGNFGWLHRRRKTGDGGNEYSNRSIRHALDNVRREMLAAEGVQVENLGNRGSEMQVSE